MSAAGEASQDRSRSREVPLDWVTHRPRQGDMASLSDAEVPRSPGAGMMTFAVWASTFVGWMLGFSIGPYVFWPLAVVFAVLALKRSRTALNTVIVGLGLLLGPAPWFAVVAWHLAGRG